MALSKTRKCFVFNALRDARLGAAHCFGWDRAGLGSVRGMMIKTAARLCHTRNVTPRQAPRDDNGFIRNRL